MPGNTTDGTTSAGWGGFNLRGWSFDHAGDHPLSTTFADATGTVSVSSTVRVLPAFGHGHGRHGAAKNIIMLGDGMGVAHRTAARIVKYGVTAGQPDGWLAMDRFPGTGLVTTHSLNSIVTDPAPGMAVGLIREEQEYGGVRVELVARVTNAKVRLQIDVGFGDAITPEASIVEYPTLLDFPSPRLRAYPRETVVAEKLEAMVHLGLANSRMKDFYDIAVLARDFDFDGDLLTRAVRATFERSKTPLPMSLPVALTATFADDPTKKTQWSGFVRKAGVNDAGSLADTVTAVAAFGEKPLLAAARGTSLTATWHAPGPWR